MRAQQASVARIETGVEVFNKCRHFLQQRASEAVAVVSTIRLMTASRCPDEDASLIHGKLLHIRGKAIEDFAAEQVLLYVGGVKSRNGVAVLAQIIGHGGDRLRSR